jgi:hypothetical protein
MRMIPKALDERDRDGDALLKESLPLTATQLTRGRLQKAEAECLDKAYESRL